jgi:DNA-nicking Smr family endonuclease
MSYNGSGNDDDKELWRIAILGSKPLEKKKLLAMTDAQINLGKKKPAKVSVSQIIPTPLPSPAKKIRTGELGIGETSRIDGSVARKLREGKYEIDATLDLHGRTQDEAFALLSSCITTAYAIGKRCILVITGKGSRGHGVIREQLPKWLNSSGLQDYILAIQQASPKHGGSGAFYVLLRKNQ